MRLPSASESSSAVGAAAAVRAGASPARHDGVTAVRSLPTGRRAVGRVEVPSSKSATHRLLALALLGGARCRVERPLLADDTRLLLAALSPLGMRVGEAVDAVVLEPQPPAAAATLRCGNAGTMLRFLVAIAASVPGSWTLDGAPRLRERPLAPLLAALRELGVAIDELGSPGHAPVRIAGGTLRGGACRLDAGESSQYLSALLLAALRAREPVTVEVERLVSAPYVELTLEAIAAAGGRVAVDGARFVVTPGMAPPARLVVEGDWSAACYPAAAAALTGGEVTLGGARRLSRQGDRRFLELLAAMGAAVRWLGDELVEVRGLAPLRAIDADLGELPDQVPTLAAVAPFARGTTRISGVPHLRLKESDRLSAMARELARLGVPVRELPAGLEIDGCWAGAAPPGDAVDCDPHDDHRIAMSLALVGLRRGGVRILDPQVVAKSYPGFWEDLERLIA
jgi:3-phosphoshikimate 1-carboxyvinyltransferase